MTSFLTIGALWLGHHAVFRRTRHADGRAFGFLAIAVAALARA